MTIFHHITASPEVLAEKLVYMDYPIGYTSNIIDDVFPLDEEQGETREEKYYKARDKAIAATLAKLNEEIDYE